MRKIIFGFYFFVYSYSFCQMQWNWVSPSTPSNTYFTSTSFGNKIFLVGSGSTFLESTDAGSSWNNLSQSFKPFAQYESGDLSNHYICFVSETTGYIADEQNVHKTTDGGKTWTPILSILPYDYCNIHFNNENVGWVSSYQKYRTTNGGKAWIPMDDFPESEGFVTGFTSIDTLRVWAFTSYSYEKSGGGKIKYSSNGGNSWIDQNIGMVSSSDTTISVIDMKMQPSGIGIASVIRNEKGTYQPKMFLLRTTNFGETWSTITNTLGMYPSVIAISDSMWIVVGNNGWGAQGSAYQPSIMRSTDFGLSWSAISFAQEKLSPRTAQYLKNQKVLIAAGWYGVIYRSMDFGITWNEISQLNPVINSLSVSNLNGKNDFGIAVGNDGYLISTKDYGEHWNLRLIDSLSNENFISSEIRKSHIMIGTDKGNLYQFDENGAQCKKITTPLDSLYGKNIPVQVKDICFKDSLHGLIVASIGYGQFVNTPSYIFYTNDACVSWKTFVLPTQMHARSITYISDLIFYVGGLYFPPSQSSGIGFIWRTTNLGQTWDTNTVPRYINVLHFNNPKDGYAGANGAVIVTNDSGKTWTDRYTDFYDVNAITQENNDVVWGVSGYTLIKSTDAGMTWFSAEPRLPSNRSATSMAVISQGKMFIALEQGGFLSSYASSITNVYQEKNFTALPEIILLKNYPNPFNPITNISFEIPLNSYVSLKIFDLTGRELVTLVAEHMLAGSYSVQWNANQYASGFYFCRLQVGSIVKTRKLLLIK